MAHERILKEIDEGISGENAIICWMYFVKEPEEIPEDISKGILREINEGFSEGITEEMPETIHEGIMGGTPTGIPERKKLLEKS